jgi:hypothetical protein
MKITYIGSFFRPQSYSSCIEFVIVPFIYSKQYILDFYLSFPRLYFPFPAIFADFIILFLCAELITLFAFFLQPLLVQLLYSILCTSNLLLIFVAEDHFGIMEASFGEVHIFCKPMSSHTLSEQLLSAALILQSLGFFFLFLLNEVRFKFIGFLTLFLLDFLVDLATMLCLSLLI